MKRIYAYGLLLVMLIGSGLNASAWQMTFQWDTPGSVRLVTGSMTGTPVELSADQTSYTYVLPEGKTFDYLYIFANEGYALANATMPNGATVTAYTNATYGQYLSFNMASGNRNNWGDDKTVKITCGKVERTSTFTLNVENGADYFTMAFSGLGYNPEFHNGTNKIAYSPAFDTMPLTIAAANGQKKIYSVKLNGVAVADRWAAYPNTAASYTIDNLQPNDELTVRVFEDSEPVVEECTLTIDLPAGFEDCINNIRNWTTSTFIYPTDIKDGKLTVTTGTDLQVNFKTDDYNYTKFMLGDTDITSKLMSNGGLRFTVDGDVTLKVEGTSAAYGEVEFTGYIMNPEGVDLRVGTYGSTELADLSAGTAITSNITVGDYTMTSANTKKYTIKVSDKNPYLYIVNSDKGYFIATALDAKKEVLGNQIDQESAKTFYIVAMPLEKNGKVAFNVTKTASVNVGNIRLTGNSALSMSWGNPEHSFSLAEGSQTIDFYGGYDNPLSVRPVGIATFQLFVDGKAQVADEEYGNFAIDAAVTDKAPMTTVDIFAGKAGTTYLTRFTVADGASATFAYSAMRHAFTEKSITLLKGTEIAVKPGANSIVKIGDEVLTPNADGECVFAVTKAQTVAVEYQEQVKTTGFTLNPASGSTVRNLNKISLYVPMLESYNQMAPDASKAVIATMEGGASYTGTWGEPGYDEATEAMIYTVEFDGITAAGTYKVTIPEGALYETAYDSASDSFVKLPGGTVTEAAEATYTVDPTLKSKMDTYSFAPAAGSGMKTLEMVSVVFPEYGPYDMFQIAADHKAAFSNGSKTVEAELQLDWNNSECRAISAMPYEPITENDAWTLTIPAGALSFEGESNEAIEATFHVSDKATMYPITPAPGTVTGNLSKFTITFLNAYEVEYNSAKAISLEGTGFATTTTIVSGTGTELTIQFATLPTAEGEYTLKIPAGAFSVDGMDSEAMEATFIYKAPYVLTPSAGSTVESLDVIMIEFPDAKEATFEGSEISFMLTNGGSYAAPGYVCEAVAAAAHPTFKLSMVEGAQRPPMGSLTLIIDEGAFLLDGVASPEIRATYELKHEVSAEYTIDPDGVLVMYDWGLNCAFLFDESTTVNAAGATFSVTMNGTELTAGSQYMVMPESNMLLFSIMEGYEEGTLKISAEAGAFTLNGQPSPAIAGEWKVIAPKTYEYSLTPDPESEKVNKLTEITIEFPEATTIKYNDFGVFMKQGYSVIDTPEVTTTDAEGRAAGASATLHFKSNPASEGDYILDVYEGAFSLDGGQASPAINVTYHYSPSTGITLVSIDGKDEFTVVGIDGRVLMVKAKADELSKLPAGIYIINGVKMHINK